MLHMLRKHVMTETLDARIANFLDTDEGAGGFTKRLLTSTCFMAAVATIVRCNTDTSIEYMGSCTSVALKRLMDIISELDDDSQSPLGRSDSRSGARKYSVQNLLDATRNVSIVGKESRTKNDTHILQNRRKTNSIPARKRSLMMTSSRRISDISITVEHESSERTLTRQLTSIRNPDAIVIESSR